MNKNALSHSEGLNKVIALSNDAVFILDVLSMWVAWMAYKKLLPALLGATMQFLILDL